MPLPDEAVYTLLSDASNALREVYHEGFADVYQRFGRTTNKIFTLSKRRIDGDGITIQYRLRNMYATRIDSDINAGFGRARAPEYGKFKAVLSENAASNHFRRLSIRLSTTYWDALRAATSDNVALKRKWTEELISQAIGDINERLAHARNLPASGLLGTVLGTPKKNDSITYSGASAIGTTGGARVVITGGSIAYFQAGMYLDRYTGSTKDGTVYVTDYNPVDNSVGLYGLDANGNPSANVNINDIASGDNFYHVDGKDKNVYSLGEWFNSSYSAGESFFLDRTTVNGRALLPTVYQPTAGANTTLSYIHLEELGQKMQYVIEDGMSAKNYVAHCPPDLEKRLRLEVGSDALILVSSDGDDGRRLAKAGFDGFSYRSPSMGRVVLSPDPLAKLNTIRFLRIGDWEMLHPGTPGIVWLPGTMAGDWYRPETGSPGQGQGTFLMKDGMMAFCDVCVAPMRRQAELAGVTA